MPPQTPGAPPTRADLIDPASLASLGRIEIIARWMNLSPQVAARVYESVRDTYSKNGIPSEEQAKAYLAMLGATAGLKGDDTAAAIFDFAPAAEAAKASTKRTP